MSSTIDNVYESHAEVKSSPTSGNGLFATKNIAAGELVLMVKRPLVGVLDIPRLEDTCSNCFMWSIGSIETSLSAEQPTVNACTGCKKVKYCSKNCQSQAWKRGHKHLCKSLKESPPLPSAVRAAIELAVLMDGSVVSDETKQAVIRMEKHTMASLASNGLSKSGGNAMQRAFGVSSDATKKIVNHLSPHLEGRGTTCEDYVGQIYRNSLTLVTPTFDPLGIAFDPLLCSANHSCDPNTVIVMDGPLISLRSLTPIPAGAEVYISYIDNTNPFSLRQAELLERYSFTCTCTKCSLGPTQREDQFLHPTSQLPKNWDKHLSNILTDTGKEAQQDPRYHIGSSAPELRLSNLQAHAFTKLESARTLSDPEAAIAVLERLMQTLTATAVWPATRQPLPAARADLVTNTLLSSAPTDTQSGSQSQSQTGNLERALHHMAKTHFATDPVLYGAPHHPVRVVRAWTLASLLLSLYAQPSSPLTRKLVAGGFDFVVVIWRLLTQIRNVVDKSHGRGGRFAALVARTVGDVRAGVGEENLRVLEADPLGQWEVFRRWGDLVG